MKLITTIILTLFAGAGFAVASERIDSVSYAFGHQYTLGIMAGKNDMMQTEQDFKDYIRGLEDNIGNPRQMADSSYMMSYCLGSMEAVFMTDGMHHKKKEDLPPFHCIISGLRKVGEGKINLPADTIAARDFLNRHSDDDKKASDFDKETECEFFTSYGIMKAYQPGLQQYIKGLNPGTHCIENRLAYATGMADILEAYATPPATAYDQGRMIALSMNMTSIEQDPIDPDSFVAGAKASLGLGPQIIPRHEVEEVLNRQFEQQAEASGAVDYEAYASKLGEYINRLEVEPACPYRVDWKVTAGVVAEFGTAPSDIFAKVMSDLKISKDVLSGILMASPLDEDGSLYEAASAVIGKYPLPNGYKWFCGRMDGLQTTIGIMRTEPEFVAEVHKASVELDRTSGMLNVQWTFDEPDTLRWAEFTEASIGKHVAVEINGKYMFAPRVNQRISGGRCAISDLTPEEINSLFKNAEKAVPRPPVDTIEVTTGQHYPSVSKAGYKPYKYDNGDDYVSDGRCRIVDKDGRIGYASENDVVIIPPRFAFGFPFNGWTCESD